MRNWLLEVWSRLRSSYWFIPAVMTLAAIALSAVVVAVDNRLGVEWIRNLGWLYENQPDGARAVLSTVAGSMITVAGVTFSMTLLAVSHASSQMGPRILSNFMRDTGNQVTLGTFIATFVYCLLILRTVRSGADVDGATISPFVPQLGILLALALALSSVAVLIYFVHHVPRTINVTHVINQTGNEFLIQIESLFPSSIGAAPRKASGGRRPATEVPSELRSAGVEISCREMGYIRRVDSESLAEVACRGDLVVELLQRPGDFVYAGTTLLRASPADRLDNETRDALREAFAIGSERSPAQDVMFAVDQLVEIATRALSPGVNDPFTAIECLHQLEGGLVALASKPSPAADRVDEDGALRVIARPHSFLDVADRVLDAFRAYGRRDMLVNLRLLRLIERVAASTSSVAERERLAMHAQAVVSSAEVSIESPRDRERLSEAHVAVQVAIAAEARVGNG